MKEFIEYNSEDYDFGYKVFGFQCHSSTCPLEGSKRQVHGSFSGKFPTGLGGFLRCNTFISKYFLLKMTKKWYSLFSGRGVKTKNLTSKNMKLKKKMLEEVSQQKTFL